MAGSCGGGGGGRDGGGGWRRADATGLGIGEVGCDGAVAAEVGRTGGSQGRKKEGGGEETRWGEKRRGGSEPLIGDLMVQKIP